ncbi:uncharacterized protein BDR25DRAFT_358465 [Lindgomyces ingoldianus]|uniref:Uncharacterized protein n=1 Tax=Lindgomyces ingoldianus TaxID=673940 RepID=A0ACB6QLA9_9PLEO|nr:uncharacterized protein BDR25DRAFT_358465 [Lindgomyces ingoldianus]KAF2467754.1 hypothetical protein BDR25DRAFT_358465 [Lindgomyces ingoldianus]
MVTVVRSRRSGDLSDLIERSAALAGDVVPAQYRAVFATTPSIRPPIAFIDALIPPIRHYLSLVRRLRQQQNKDSKMQKTKETNKHEKQRLQFQSTFPPIHKHRYPDLDLEASISATKLKSDQSSNSDLILRNLPSPCHSLAERRIRNGITLQTFKSPKKLSSEPT